MARASTITTSIRSEDLVEFRNYLLGRGYTEISVFEAKDKLSIYFENPVEAMTFRLKGIEEDYKALRSKEYFYDLHDTWNEEEARSFFGNEDY